MPPGSRSAADERQHFDAWRRIFDRQAMAAARTRDFANVWISSFSGEQISEAEIEEWVDTTCDLIRRYDPRRVLDIGCGTGLIMSRLAPAAERYVGVDISPRTVDLLRRRIADESIPAEVHRSRADDLRTLTGQRFDTFILNSVVQYFPSIDHLESVLRQVLDLADIRSTIIIGDVRNRALLEAFHLEVALAHSSPDDMGQDVRDRAARRLRSEPELVLDPCEVRELVARVVPEATVEVAPKRGRFQNEMSRFRYDVIVSPGLDAERQLRVPEVWLEWGGDVGSVPAIVASLGERSSVGVRGVPNRRTPWTKLADVPVDLTVRGIQARGEERAMSAVDPEVLCRALEDAGLDARLSWGPGSSDGAFDVIVRRPDQIGDDVAGMS